MAMARGKMLQLEESPAEKEKGGEAITSNEEKSTTGVASTTKEPEANRVVRGETLEPRGSKTISPDPANFFFCNDEPVNTATNGGTGVRWGLRVEQ